MRLDDACTRMNTSSWLRMEKLLDKYGVKPLVGVIPDCKDSEMSCYSEDKEFWKKALDWQKKGWVLALHGFEHLYVSKEAGINPMHERSEFAGLSLEEQKEKIKTGIGILRTHGIDPKVFFAPSHTFDLNTIESLKIESNIRIISDTIADKPYSQYGMTFVPQQSRKARKLPFSVTTFCYHPNMMTDGEFEYLEGFLKGNRESFIPFPVELVSRKLSIYDRLLRKLYFLKH